MNRIKCFFDCQFTGLHKGTTLISLGIVSEDGRIFYAEFTDYDKGQIDVWLEKNVIKKLKLPKHFTSDKNNSSLYPQWERVRGNKAFVVSNLIEWLGTENQYEMWSDCLSFDWVMFCDLFGHAFKVPSNILYIPFDISTLFKDRGIDPDINREEFCEGKIKIYGNGRWEQDSKHNALWDAFVIKSCYDKLMSGVAVSNPSQSETETKDRRLLIEKWIETHNGSCTEAEKATLRTAADFGWFLSKRYKAQE